MDTFSIDKLLSERQYLLERLKKVDSAMEVLKDLYPDLFSNGQSETTTVKPNKTPIVEIPLEWNRSFSFRKNLLSLLKKQGKYTKVATLATIARKYEQLQPGESEDDFQNRVSRTLTALKSEGKHDLELVKVHSGSSGIAWGFISYRDSNGNIKPEHRYVFDKEEQSLFAK